MASEWEKYGKGLPSVWLLLGFCLGKTMEGCENDGSICEKGDRGGRLCFISSISGVSFCQDREHLTAYIFSCR